MSYKWKPSKVDAEAFRVKMAEIEKFCMDHDIKKSFSGDSYYFRLNDHDYRVSNHTIEASNRGAYNEAGDQIRELYHDENDSGMICITAGKMRIIDIYTDLAAGYALDKRGNRIT